MVDFCKPSHILCEEVVATPVNDFERTISSHASFLSHIGMVDDLQCCKCPHDVLYSMKCWQGKLWWICHNNCHSWISRHTKVLNIKAIVNSPAFPHQNCEIINSPSFTPSEFCAIWYVTWSCMKTVLLPFPVGCACKSRHIVMIYNSAHPYSTLNSNNTQTLIVLLGWVTVHWWIPHCTYILQDVRTMS